LVVNVKLFFDHNKKNQEFNGTTLRQNNFVTV
jgi:hypothetical protein